MSFPSNETIYGQVTYNGVKYDLLNNPLGNNEWEKIQKYKKTHNAIISTAPWNVNSYQWKIIDDKLYLVGVTLKFYKNDKITFDIVEKECMVDIFKNESIFINYFNGTLKLLVSKKEIQIEKNNWRCICERDILLLRFDNGIISNIKKYTEQYKSNSLKYLFEYCET